MAHPDKTRLAYQELTQLLSLLRRPRTTPGGFVLEFIAAHTGDGTSSIVRELALKATHEFGLSVTLLDLDWRENRQFRLFSETSSLHPSDNGSGPIDQTLIQAKAGTQSFERQIALQPTAQLAFHRVGDSRLVISEARSALAQRISYPNGEPNFWTDLRFAADLVLIDAPAADRSLDGVIVSPAADAVIMVVAAEQTSMADAVALRDRLQLQGGRPAGIVFNQDHQRLPRVLRSAA